MTDNNREECSTHVGRTGIFRACYFS